MISPDFIADDKIPDLWRVNTARHIGVGWVAMAFAVLAVLLSGYALTAPVWYDDAGHWIVLRSWFTEGALCYPHDPAMGLCRPHSPFITLGPAVYYPAIAWSVLTGYDMPIIRMMMVAAGLLAAISYFQWVLALRNQQLAWLSMLLACFNIQYLSYGSQFLGEVPMMGFLFLLFLQLHYMLHGDQVWARAALAGLGAGLAILTKEYALGIAGWGYAGALLLMWRTGRRKHIPALFASGAIALLIWASWNRLVYGGWEAWISGLEARSSYSGEFLIFGWNETLPFLVKKPVIWLGAVAIGVRFRFRREPADLLLGWCWIGQLLFFLFSAGYDRFGFQLAFIPAIFLSEFVLFGWKFARNTGSPVFWRSVLVLVCFAIASQRALPVLAGRWMHPERMNSGEKQVSAYLQRSEITSVFTYDQQLIPFLSPEVVFRLADKVPSAASLEPAMMLRDHEVFVSGPYAETEYLHSVNWNSLEPLYSTPDGVYTVYRQVDGNFFANAE